MCPPGEYQKSCKKCEPCPAGSYTTDWNYEKSCFDCFGDCRTEFHLKVIQQCTSTSDLKCICKDGFLCDKVPFSENCRYCVKIRDTTATEESYSSQLAAILCPVVAAVCVALVILRCVRRPREETCFKQAIAKLCKVGRDASRKSKESTHQFPRDSFSAKQQPSSLSAANLGPVHVHNRGTVIFSLLSQFTGQIGPTSENVSSEEEDDRACPVYHPTSSPSVPLSEEEKSDNIDSIFFPSQEQGKECHVSKEEVL
ncbi:hypothetical protein PAMP_002963 [Pampus punctatissimus]